MSPWASVSDFEAITFGYALSSRPVATGWEVPSGQTSEITAQMAVSGAVLDRRRSSATGPAESRSCVSGAVV